MENPKFFEKVQPVLGFGASLFIFSFALYHSYVYLKLITSESYGSNITGMYDISLVQAVVVICICHVASMKIRGGRQEGRSDGGVPPKPNESGDN